MSRRVRFDVDPDAHLSDNTAVRVRAVVESIRRRYLSSDRRAWIVGFSGGKDSTFLAHLVFEAVREVPPSRRLRPVYFVSSDTQVETPAIIEFMREQSRTLGEAAANLGLPFESHIVSPELLESFWVRLIGYGYPAPNRSFRWCTERLKIKPTNAFILNKIDEFGEVIILLGSRIDESGTRARSIKKHHGDGTNELNPHSNIRRAHVWAPIKAIKTDEVWEYLAFNAPPWGGSHRRLQNLYKEANSGECPIVLDETTRPCGNSRFGCWTCTVVERDRSIEGFIGSGRTEYQGMADFRNWLIELRDNPQKYREEFRRNGQPGNGPLRMEVRKAVLQRLLTLQEELGEKLVSDEEVVLIRQMWLSDSMIDDRSRQLESPDALNPQQGEVNPARPRLALMVV